jgi:hypothetical protein
VIWIGRVLSRKYLAGFAQDGWLFGGRDPDAHPRSSPGVPSVCAFSPRSVRGRRVDVARAMWRDSIGGAMSP